MRNQNPLEKIDGVKIRSQFFDGFCMFVFFWVVAQILSFFLAELLSGTTKISWVWDSVRITVAPSVGLFLLFAIAAFLSRFFIGPVVCVLNEEGIHYKDGVIPWDEVREMEFCRRVFGHGRSRHTIYFMTVYCKRGIVELMDAPSYLYWEAKKWNPAIKPRFRQTLIYSALEFALLLAIALAGRF